MKRDGACTSLWQTIPDYESRTKTIPPNTVFDVVIVGGGMSGVTLGLILQKAGKSVLIAESYTLCFGTTGGTTAHLNSFFETPFTTISKDFGSDNAKLAAKAGRDALDLIKKNVQQYNIDCGYKELPAYLYAQDEKQIKPLDDFYEGFEKVGVEASLSNTIPVKIPFEKAVEVPAQGQFHPTQYVFGLAKEFENTGGAILQNCRVTGVDENEILEVKTTRGSIKAKNLVYATHIPPGVNILHFRCAPYRSYAIAFKLKNENDYPQALAYDMADPYHYFRTQEVDGQLFLIAGGEDHKTAHEENTEGCFKKLEAFVRNFYEVENVAYKWSSQYFEPVDGLPYIGHLPGHDKNMFVATGYAGVGMMNSHIAAITLSDILLTGKSEYEKLFNPNRVKPIAGFTQFVKESADVVAKFIGDRMSKEKIHDLAELAPGEAKVVKYEGHTLALYKDDEGELHACNSACTHVKCIVGWNASEKTWDCPCHGSRFSYDGAVVTGPARKDLEQIKMLDLVKDDR